MELLLWIVRFAMLGLMILLLLFVAFTLRADLRSAGASPRESESPTPSPPATPSKTSAKSAIRLIAYLTGPQPENGRAFPLTSELIIGRDATCQIVIANSVTSKRHARVYPQDGGWYIADAGSTNGTLLNGMSLRAPARLHVGDRLRIGETEFEIR